MTLDTDFERVTLALDTPFTIARGTRETATNVTVRITDETGRVGIGGAAPSSYYGETPGTVEAVMPDLLAVVEAVGDPHALREIERRLREVVRDNPAARAAISIALHDLVGKRLDLPLYRYWGLDPGRAPATSFTIGIDAPDVMAERAAAAVEEGFSTLKLKVGTDGDADADDGQNGDGDATGTDRERVAAVREAAPEATIRVDANEAWTPHEAVRKTDWLADQGVEFVEQPVPAGNPEGLKFVRERTPLPIAADESCVTLPDVDRIADRADVAVIKVMKCGGLREVIRMIHAAHAAGLEVMLGCMVETDASIAAACHLAPLAEYVDLDGSALLADDPYAGVEFDGNRIALADAERPGTGACRE